MSQSHRSLLSRDQVSWPTFGMLFGTTLVLARLCSQTLVAAPTVPTETTLTGTARNALAWSFAKLIEDAIPEHYEKQKDWGRRKNLTVGIRADGLKLHRRKKPVKHGVWKHYAVDLVDPDQNLSVRIEDLRTTEKGRMAFTLVLSAKLKLWARAKAYQYGVHLIALETEGQTDFDLAIDCDVGVGLVPKEGKSTAVIDPQISAAQLTLREFSIDRISNAKGPLVKEIGEEIRHLVEKELQGPKLTAKLNRAIEKKRDRLEIELPGFMTSSWWPLASLPGVQDAIEQETSIYR